MPQPEEQTRSVGIEGLAVCHRCGRGHLEEAPVALGRGLVLGRVVDLLEHVRHREHGCRLVLDQVRDDVLDVAGVRHVDPVVYRGELDRPRQDVSEWEELQGPGVFVEDTFGDAVGCAHVVHLVQEVGVSDDAALRPPSGARGVDDRGQGFAVHGGPALHDRFIGDIASRGDECVDSAGVDNPHVAQFRQANLRLGDRLRVVGGLDERSNGP